VINAIAKKKRPSGLSGELLAVEPEYRFSLYKKLTSAKMAKKVRKGSPVLPGSYENGKRR
jgi:hypothetical protein